MRRPSGNPVWLAGFSVLAFAISSLAFEVRHSPEWSKLPDAEFKDVIVRLERGSCARTCPVYKVTVHGDGRVEYEGEKNVRFVGRQEGQIEITEVRRMVAEFEKIDYFSLHQRSRCPLIDNHHSPRVTTELQWRGVINRLWNDHNYFCFPMSLRTLENAIDRIAQTEQWTGQR